MIKAPGYYFYSTRYKRNKNLLENRGKLNRLKEWLFLFIANSRLKKFLHSADWLAASHRKIRNIYAANDGFNIPEKEYIPFTDLAVKQIQFYDVIEIDQFDSFRKRILSFAKKVKVSKLLSRSGKISDRDYSELKKRLSGMKSSLDTVQSGGLFTVDYRDTKAEKSSFIKYADIDYLKTQESYFILRINITPSDEFNEQLKNIFSSQDGSISIPHYNSLKEIIGARNFVRHHLYLSSIKQNNLSLLFKDLNYQAQDNISSKLRGVFTEFDLKQFLPFLVYFETSNGQEIFDDPPLNNYFRSFYYKELFKDPKSKISISVPMHDLRIGKNNSIKLIYEKNNEIQSKVDPKEFYFLSQNLTFPWVIINITRLYRDRINNLKRDIYDYIDESANQNLAFRLIRFFKRGKYIKLKTRLVKYKLIFKRFESEFSDESLKRFFIEDSLEDFQTVNVRNEKKNLLSEFVKSFKYDLEELTKDIETINDSFKNIEEINTYKTNLFLQYFSILIGVLAFIFSFSNVKDAVLKVVEWIKNLF